jgi:hypothetical protein
MKLLVKLLVVVIAAVGISYGAHSVISAVSDTLHTVIYNSQLDNRGLHD